MSYKHRKKGYKYLSGRGLEIGALHEPAKLGKKCTVTYADAMTRSEAIKLFPEIDQKSLVDVDIVINLDTEGLSKIDDASFDFVILNHVIEHVANPIRVVGELFRVAKDGAAVVIAAPDKRYTFDRDRENTSFEHLREEFKMNVSSVSDEHYLDFLKHVHPDVMKRSDEEIKKSLNEVRGRREHAHVWDSVSFKEFLQETVKLLNITCSLLYESKADKNKIEYFSVWQKGTSKKKKLWKLFKREDA